MSRLTDNDRNLGPFTFARWPGYVRFALQTEREYYGPSAQWSFIANAFGVAMRVRLPRWLPSPGSDREYGFSVSKNDGGEWNFVSFYYGIQTHDSSTEKRWSFFLPWSEWEHVRFSLYNPDGSHFWTQRDRRTGLCGFDEQFKQEEAVPKVHFGFQDYDGEFIVATCHIEEREWHRGRGWLKWLRWFCQPIIRRSLSLRFSAEVGREKGSWKGGTTGHGIDMLSVETPRQAFERYCKKDHRSKSGPYRIMFIGPCSAPVKNKAEA